MTASATEAIEAPDFAEPIEAWRVWRVVASRDGYRLGSVVYGTVWPASAALVAGCMRSSQLTRWLRHRGSTRHPVPDESCECGIYATFLPSLRQYLRAGPVNPALGRVLGTVSLWGTVIECDRGFHASHAYPLRLYVPVDSALAARPRWEDLAAGLEVYRVPVELLPARCFDAVDALESVQLASLRPPDG